MDKLTGYFWLLLPIVLAAVCNMLWVRLPAVKRVNRAMDGGRPWKDGRPLLGDHKTWMGFWGMPAWSAFWLTVFAWLNRHLDWASSLDLLDAGRWPWPETALLNGALWGLGYVLAELPNSFVKRRFKIAPGKTARGLSGLFFIFIDQADSVIGCLATMQFFHRPGPGELLALFFLGTGIHYLVNVMLYFAGLKKQMG